MRSPAHAILAVVLIVAMVPGSTGAVSVGGTGVADAQAATCSFPFSATDVTGTEVTVEEEPQRIVTLNPSAAQTMWEIGGEEKVVGVSEYASYLDGAESRTNISAAGRAFVNVEKVVAAEPDLVLAPYSIPTPTVSKLRDSGLTVYKFRESKTIGDVENKTLRTGKLAGECGGARDTVDWMDQRLDTVSEAVEGQDRPRVLYVFFGYTGGSDTYVHNMLTTAGGTNVAAEAGLENFTQFSAEIVVEQNPEWIVLNDAAPTVPDTEAYNSTYAVQHNQTVVLNENYVSQPAPRVVLAVTKLVKTFHPEAYAAANETAEPGATTAETATATASETRTTTTPSDTNAGGGVPGFGVGVALVALVGAVLLGRQR